MSAKSNTAKHKTSQLKHYDVVIVGGGFVGLSLAAALARIAKSTRLNIALLEHVDYQRSVPPGFDSRSLALSYSSIQIFKGLGIWPQLAEQVAGIKQIHISDTGHPGLTHLDAREQGLELMGAVVENAILGKTLYDTVAELDEVDIYAPVDVTHIELGAQQGELTVNHHGEAITFNARLVVAADGSESFVRKTLGIAQWQSDYHQHAIIANVACERSHDNRAYERFTATGPMAMLPLTGFAEYPHRYALVWTVPDSELESTLELDNDAALEYINKQFARRTGKITHLGERVSYPLGMRQTRENVRQRLAFIGNASHTLHPVAGQGFNLGLRDVAALAEVIRDHAMQGHDFGQLEYLKQYAKWRRSDHLQTALFTDSLVRVFSNDSLPLIIARNAGLFALEMFKPLRKKVMHHAMGVLGTSSLLARGLDL